MSATAIIPNVSRFPRAIIGTKGFMATRTDLPHPATDTEPEPLLGITELATWLGVSPATIYHWRNTGSGPPVHKVGRHLRYQRSEVQAWLESQT